MHILFLLLCFSLWRCVALSMTFPTAMVAFAMAFALFITFGLCAAALATPLSSTMVSPSTVVFTAFASALLGIVLGCVAQSLGERKLHDFAADELFNCSKA